MATQKILVPYNFTDIDRKALGFLVTNFANNAENRVTLFHAYNPVPKIDTDADPIMSKLKSNVQMLNVQVHQREEEMKKLEAYLLGKGFAPGQVDHIFKERDKDLADEIIETTVAGGYNTIVLGRKPKKATRFFVRSSFTIKILSSLSDVGICIVT